jgi:hypothetical protein
MHKSEALGVVLPAPEFFDGIQQVIKHNQKGHMSYLLGKFSMTGFWYYYPVVLALKAPLGYLVLLAVGVAAAWRRRGAAAGAWLALGFSGAVLLVGSVGHINIGLRHILPVFLGFSLAAAGAFAQILRNAKTGAWLRYGVLAAALWFAGSSLLNHPDYIAYTNEFVDDEPWTMLADSDFDWGQDLRRLSAKLRELRAPEVYLAPFAPADYVEEHGFPPSYGFNPWRPAPGWNALSVSAWKVSRFGLLYRNPEAKFWPDSVKPTDRVGGFLLYYFPAPPQR